MQYLLSKDELDSLNGENKFNDAILAFEKELLRHAQAIVESARDLSWDDGRRFRQAYGAAITASVNEARKVLGLQPKPTSTPC